MTDFCIETTAIHDIYVDEFNVNIIPLVKKLPNTQFVVVTDLPDKVTKSDNLKIVDIKKYTSTIFKKRYDNKGGFFEILQATRFGIYEAFNLGYLKVLHINTDAIWCDHVNENNISNHFNGMLFDMGAHPISKWFNIDQKIDFLRKYIKPEDELKIYKGDEPVVFIQFDSKDQFSKFIFHMDKICKETFENNNCFETGMGTELVISYYLAGGKFFTDYESDYNKIFDVDNSHLHLKHYDDRDPNTIR